MVLAGGRYISENLLRKPIKIDVENDAEAYFRGENNILTLRQIEIVRSVSLGMTNKEIARKLNISPTTVQTHLANIYDGLKVNNRTEAVHKAREIGIISVSDSIN